MTMTFPKYFPKVFGKNPCFCGQTVVQFRLLTNFHILKKVHA